MSKQVLDIEQMHHLQELGLDTSKAIMCYRRITHDFRGKRRQGIWNLTFNQPLIACNFETYEDVPTFTLQEILDSLPLIIEHNSDKYELRIKRMVFAGGVKYAVLYEEQEYINWYIMQSYENLIDAAYEMLCWCIENGFVKNK